MQIVEGSKHLQVDYSCLEECDVPGCKNDTDGTMHCCCKGQHCNNDQLATEAFKAKCRMQHCVNGTNEKVECGQRFEYLRASTCDLEHVACSVEMHLEMDGMKMTSACEESCHEDGCRWEGDVYRCCCSEDTCEPNQFAQKALDDHCKRRRCVVASQAETCQYKDTFKAASERHLCEEEEDGCGLFLQEYGGGEQIIYSCVNACEKNGCWWEGDKPMYVCCCGRNNCNNQNMTYRALQDYCSGPPPTLGQKQLRGKMMGVLLGLSILRYMA